MIEESLFAVAAGIDAASAEFCVGVDSEATTTVGRDAGAAGATGATGAAGDMSELFEGRIFLRNL